MKKFIPFIVFGTLLAAWISIMAWAWFGMHAAYMRVVSRNRQACQPLILVSIFEMAGKEFVVCRSAEAYGTDDLVIREVPKEDP